VHNGEAEVEHIEIGEEIGDYLDKFKMIGIAESAEADKALDRLGQGVADNINREKHKGVQGKTDAKTVKKKPGSQEQGEFKKSPVNSPEKLGRHCFAENPGKQKNAGAGKKTEKGNDVRGPEKTTQ